MPGPDHESKEPPELSDPAIPPPAVLPRRGVRGAPENTGTIPIYMGERFILGMKLAASIWGQMGSFYYLAPQGTFALAAERKFPLTEKGWNRMWHEFATKDPSGARACKQELHRRAIEAPPDKPAASAPHREPSEATAGEDALDRLERLAELHRQGALTDDEFDQAKRELLKKIA